LVLECQPGDILEYQVEPNDLNATEN
jgi:DNA-binding Xre family transcriptional regulator